MTDKPTAWAAGTQNENGQELRHGEDVMDNDPWNFHSAALAELRSDVWTEDQLQDLEDMLHAMEPLLRGRRYGRGNWPWQVGHPWRQRLGSALWATGYRLMHGVPLRRPTPKPRSPAAAFDIGE